MEGGRAVEDLFLRAEEVDFEAMRKMIKKLTTVKDVGNFIDFRWDESVPPFGTTNIIFGYNGSGKTILSNIFHLFSAHWEDGGKQLFDDLKNSEQAIVKLEVDEGVVQYKKDGAKHDIYVFNCDFVREHVYDGSVSKCKEFDPFVVTNEQLKNPKIQSIEKEIEEIEREKDENEKEVIALNNRFDEVRKEISDEFNSKIKGSRIPTIQPLLESQIPQKTSVVLRDEVDKLYENYALSQKQEEVSNDLVSTQRITLNEILLDVDLVRKALEKNISEESSKKVLAKINRLADFKPLHATLNEWFEDGYSLLKYVHENKECACPLCNNNVGLTIGSLIQDYQLYFNDEYKELKDLINTLISNVDADLINIGTNNNGLDELKVLVSKYSNFVSMGKMFNFQYGNLEAKLKETKKELQHKLDNMSSSVKLATDCSDIIIKYNETVRSIEMIRSKLLGSLQEHIFDPQELLRSIRASIPHLVYATFDTANLGNQIIYYQSLNKKIRALTTSLDGKRTDRKREISKMKDESKNVNSFLKHLGVHNFEIDIQKGKPEENVLINYKSGTTKTRLLHALSEGEKTALAFAYFLSKIKYEILDNPKRRIDEIIIVIDDPISSLDENRLYNTACLIRDIFANSKQFFILSHNLVFLKFMGNMISNKENRQDYYLYGDEHGVKIVSLPAGLTNFQTSYFQKLHEVMAYNEGAIGYEDAKKFIPNYIRVVLETFLCFKFFVLKHGNSGDKFRSAGLDKLTRTITGQLGLFAHFPAVGDVNCDTLIRKLDHIHRMSDPQSHGSSQSLDEFNFISESELKSIAKDTLNIIQFFDNIHFDQISKKKGT